MRAKQLPLQGTVATSSKALRRPGARLGGSWIVLLAIVSSTPAMQVGAYPIPLDKPRVVDRTVHPGALPIPIAKPLVATAKGTSPEPPAPDTAAYSGVLPIPIPKPVVATVQSTQFGYGLPVPIEKPPVPSASVPLHASSGAGNSNGAMDQAVTQACGRIAEKLSSVGFQECLEIGLEPSEGVSVLGTPILVKEYPPAPRKPAHARVLVVGGTHGDEYSAVSVIFKWLSLLDKHHAGLFHWRITPLMNPDGLLRKRSTRTNENGVDLNRNFPTPNWVEESHRYWVKTTGRNPRRYPGVAPMSEPESRWLVSEIERFKPDAIIATHAPHGVVDFDGPPKGPGSLGDLRQQLLGTYPGSLGNFAGVLRQLPVVTIEFSSAGAMPKPSEISRIWTDLEGWLLYRFPGHDEPRELRAYAGDL